MKRKKWTFHPLAELFPPMSDEDVRKLADDIKKNRLMEPIDRLDGQILDGRSRLRACEMVGVTPRFRTLPKGTDPLAFVVSRNLKRRHLTVGERARVATKIEKRIAAQAKEKEHARKTGTLMNSSKSTLHSRKQAAKIAKVSESSVGKMKRLEKEAPDLAEEVGAGKSLHAAYTEMKRRAAGENPKTNVRVPFTPERMVTNTLPTLQKAERMVKEIRGRVKQRGTPLNRSNKHVAVFFRSGQRLIYSLEWMGAAAPGKRPKVTDTRIKRMKKSDQAAA